MSRFSKILAASMLTAVIVPQTLMADNERLVILHTNDTHSQIEPTDKGLGGVFRRKVVIDSVRAAEPNVMLVDAGDAVQGTLYFSLYGGEVERKMMNLLGYDLAILGNHEFDNGMEALAEYCRGLDAKLLSTNYDLEETPLKSLFAPYDIRNIGDKRVAFIAINLRPDGMIADANSTGVEYLDGMKAANATAWHLRHNEKVDYIVALTHVGYKDVPDYSDLDLASGSENIDLIIGGHSHTTLNPSDPKSGAWKAVNAVGDTIIVAQTGKQGQFIGEIAIDLPSKKTDYRLIRIDDRLDSRVDTALDSILAPYRHGVDSIRNIKVGKTRAEMPVKEPGILNFISDFVEDYGSEMAGNVDLAIMNVGGIRSGFRKGIVTKGDIMQMLPFDNRIVVLELSGRDLLDAMDVMASRGGDGVSKGINATFDPSTGRCTKVLLNGQPIDPEATYRLATIDYLAKGGDYMTPLTRGKISATSDQVLYDALIDYFVTGPYKGVTIKPDNTVRMHK